MPRGYSGGYRRHRPYPYVNFRFAQAVRRVDSKYKNAEKFLEEPNSQRVCHQIFAGDLDSAFIVPGTEVCRPADRGDAEKDEEGNIIMSRAVRLDFDIVASRSYSVRVMAVRPESGPASNVFSVGSPNCLTATSFQGRICAPVESTDALASRFLVGANGVLEKKEPKSPFYWPLKKEAKKRVFVDRVYNGRPMHGVNCLDSRPFNVYVRMNRRLEFSGDGSDCLLKTTGQVPVDFNVYFVVLVHVPSFTLERVSRMPSVSRMQLDDEDKGKVLAQERSTSRSDRAPPRPSSSESQDSEASTIILERVTKQVLPAVEVRNIRSSFYWIEKFN